MKRRDALRGLFGGMVALAIGPTAVLRRPAALEPTNYIGDASSMTMTDLSGLVHQIFVDGVAGHVARESPIAQLFSGPGGVNE